LSDEEFNRVFGSAPAPRASFTERIGRADSLPPDTEPNKLLTAGSGTYKAFGYLPVGVAETCDIQRWLDGTDTQEGIEFPYKFLIQLGYVGEEEIRLFLPDCIVIITGKRLRELRQKLARRQVTFVCQYSPRVWPKTPSAQEPVVAHIAVVRPNSDLEEACSSQS
jgi:hypothetical protein